MTLLTDTQFPECIHHRACVVAVSECKIELSPRASSDPRHYTGRHSHHHLHSHHSLLHLRHHRRHLEIRDIFRLLGGTAHAYAYSAGCRDVGAASACPLPVERASLIGGSVVPARWVEAAGPPAGCGGDGGHRVRDTPTTDAVGPPPKTLDHGTRSSIVRVRALQVCSVTSSVITLRYFMVCSLRGGV